MSSRKEERQQLRDRRQELEERARSKERRWLIVGCGIAALLLVPLLVGAVVLISSGGGGSAYINMASGATNGRAADEREGVSSTASARTVSLDSAVAKADCALRRKLRDEGATHLPEGAPAPEYSTNPATSGDHSAITQADGAYSELLSPLNSLHSLEHGRIGIQYDPSLSEDRQLELKGIFEESPGGMLLFPNPKMPYEVAAAAWTNLLTCERYQGARTLEALRAFRDQFRGRGPEAVPLDPS